MGYIEKVVIRYAEGSAAKNICTIPDGEEITYQELAKHLKKMLFRGETHAKVLAADFLMEILPYSAVNIDVDSGAATIISKSYGEKEEIKIGEEVFVRWFDYWANEAARARLVVTTEFTIR